MQDKRDLPFSTASPSGNFPIMQGGNRSSPSEDLQPPSVDSARGHGELPVGALIRYLGTHRRVTFDDWQSDIAILLDRKLVHREVVGGPQPNPDVWPFEVSILLIYWLQESGRYIDDRWKPRAWVEQDGEFRCLDGYLAGRGPLWVMEHAGTGTGSIMWEVIE